MIHNNVCFNSASDSIDSGDGITIPCQTIKELLTRERGANNIPLSYIIRSENNNYDTTFDSTEAQLRKCIALIG